MLRIPIFRVVVVARVIGRQVGVRVAEEGVEIRLCRARARAYFLDMTINPKEIKRNESKTVIK